LRSKISQNGDQKRILFGGASRQMKGRGLLRNLKNFLRLCKKYFAAYSGKMQSKKNIIWRRQPPNDSPRAFYTTPKCKKNTYLMQINLNPDAWGTGFASGL
jgi:hypothetical protein